MEKKFGGEADSPTNFWPPYVGKHFVPDTNTDRIKFMSDDEYMIALEDNPELPVHPNFINKIEGGEKRSRDFTLCSGTSTRAETVMLNIEPMDGQLIVKEEKLFS